MPSSNTSGAHNNTTTTTFDTTKIPPDFNPNIL